MPDAWESAGGLNAEAAGDGHLEGYLDDAAQGR